MEIGAAVACSVVLHGAFMAYGSWQDSTMAVKYTDIDYWVISDAAKLLSVGKSPFDRPTYRYTPLLAALLVPNNFYGENFGKFIFSALDIFCMLLIYSLLRKQSVPNRKSALISSLIFGCNPLVITVSTRGNAESLVCLLSLLTIWLLSARKRAMAAICVGFGIHTKLFPVLYLPSILVFMGVFPGQSRSAQATYILPSTPLKQDDQQKKKQRVIDIKWKHIQFVVMTISTFLFCSAITFHFFGHKGIHESILYHVSRKDHRHNFSPYWLMFYYNATLKLPDYAISLLPFIPQALLSLYIAYGYGKKDLCFAVFLQTFVFVTMNKVCTSQYFLWYLCLLPVCLPSLKAARWENWLSIGGIWLGFQALFLSLAYKLEFLGMQVFEQVWMSSIGFMIANVWIASRLVTLHGRSKLMNKAF